MSAQRLEHQTFVDLLELLEAKYVTQPGTRDREGNMLFVLHDVESRSDRNYEPRSVLSALTYLVSSWIRYVNYARDDETANNNERSEARIALLIDRRSGSWQQVETLVSSINDLIEGNCDLAPQPNELHVPVNWGQLLRRIYIFKSVGFSSLFSNTNAQKSLMKQSRVPLVFVSLMTQLNALIAPDSLPAGSPFNGCCAYEHESWLKQRNAVESYLAVAGNFERKAAALAQRWRTERGRMQQIAREGQGTEGGSGNASEADTLVNTSAEESSDCAYNTVDECTFTLAEEEKRAYGTLISMELFLEDVDSLIDHCASPVAPEGRVSSADSDGQSQSISREDAGCSSNASTLKDGTLRMDPTRSLHVRVLERARRQLAEAYTRYRHAWNTHRNALQHLLDFRIFEERATKAEHQLETCVVEAIETLRRNALEATRLDELETILNQLIALQTDKTSQDCMKQLSELLLFGIDREASRTDADSDVQLPPEADSATEELDMLQLDWTSRLNRLRQASSRLGTLLEQCESLLRTKQRILTVLDQLQCWCTRCDTLLDALACPQSQPQVSDSDTQNLAAFAAEHDVIVALLASESDSDDPAATSSARLHTLVQDATARLKQLRDAQSRLEQEEVQRQAQLERESRAESEKLDELPVNSRLSEVIANTLTRKTTRRGSAELLRRPTDDIVIGPKVTQPERVLDGDVQPPTPPDSELAATSNAASFENGFSTLKRLREIQQLELTVTNCDEPVAEIGASSTPQAQPPVPATANTFPSGTLRLAAPSLRHSPSVAVKDKHFLRCRYVVNELIETERAYVADLETVVRGYAEAWRSDAALELKLPAVFRSEPDTHFSTLFGNMPAILDFHKSTVLNHLLASTLPNGQNTLREGEFEFELCDVFIANEIQFVDLYATYCQGRSAADGLLRAANRGDLDASPLEQICAACEKERASQEPPVRAERKSSSAKRPSEETDGASRAGSLKRVDSSCNASPSRSGDCKCQSPGSLASPGDTTDEHAYFRECRRRLRHRLPLDAYLLKPTQRITKYQLLLTDLLRSMKSFQASSGEQDDAARARLTRFCGRVERVEHAQRTMLRVLASINNAMHEAMIVACPKRNLAQFGPLLLQVSCTVFYKLPPPRANAAGQDRNSVYDWNPPQTDLAELAELPDGNVNMRHKRISSSASAQSLSAFANHNTANTAATLANPPPAPAGATISASLKQHYYSQRTHHRHLFLYERCILFCKPMNVDDSQSVAHDSSLDNQAWLNSSGGPSRLSVLRGETLNGSGSVRSQPCVGLPIGSRQVRYRIKHILELNRVGLTESLPGNPRRFELWTPREREKYIIEMKKADEKTTWTEAIKTLLFKQLQEIKQRRSSIAIGVHYIDLHVGIDADQLHTVSSSTLHASSALHKFAHPDSPDGLKQQSQTRHARRGSLTMLREQSLPETGSNPIGPRPSSKTGLRVAGKVFKKQIARIGQKLGSNSASKKSNARLSLQNQAAVPTNQVSQPLAERHEPESTTESEFEADNTSGQSCVRAALNLSVHSADHSVVSSLTVASSNTCASSSSSASGNRSPSASVTQADAAITTSSSVHDCEQVTHRSTCSLTETDSLPMQRCDERADDENSVSTQSAGSTDSAASLHRPPLDLLSDSPFEPRPVDDNALADKTVCIGTPSLVRFDASTLRRPRPALYVALSDYIAVTDRELSVSEGDMLQAARKRNKTTTKSEYEQCDTGTESEREEEPIYADPTYLYMRKLATDEFGYVPTSYVTRNEPLADTTLNESIL